jgi:hypothetical protein
MTRPPPLLPPSKLPGLTASSGDSILQIKVRLVGVSPMIWRRVLVAADTTLRELHGVLQVPMGWQGLHLFQFCLRAVRYGSSERVYDLLSSSPLASPRVADAERPSCVVKPATKRIQPVCLPCWQS